MRRRRLRVLVGFAVASLLLGGTFVAAKAGLAYVPPLLFVALRFDVATVVLLGYVLVRYPRDEWLPTSRADVVGVLATGAVTIGLTNALLFVGQQYATSAVAAIVFSLNPILTPVFAAVLLAEERLSRRGTAGLALGFVGVALVIDPSSAMLGGGGGGKAILFGAAVSGALGSVLIRRTGGTLSSTVRTAWGLPVAAVLCHAASLAAGESAPAVWPLEAVVALLYVAVFAGAIAYLAYFGLLDDVGAIRANLVFYLVPLVTTAGGWALLGERVSAGAFVGFGVIFAGFALLGSESVDRSAVRERVETLQTALLARVPRTVRSSTPLGVPVRERTADEAAGHRVESD